MLPALALRRQTMSFPTWTVFHHAGQTTATVSAKQVKFDQPVHGRGFTHRRCCGEEWATRCSSRVNR
ncbi:hypothetical protein AB0A63_11080 [Lentzea sp. NPDC042327]|uniref:hypothetical protein n=1 Tax=Lentzea sp. NPDC042327 TaxID=3154801 RepID=UPI0033EF1D18